MFRILIESVPQAGPGTRQYLASLCFHGLVVASAIALTRHASTALPQRRAEPAILYVASEPTRSVVPRTRHQLPHQASPAPPVWQPAMETPILGIPKLVASVPTVADLLGNMSPDPASIPGVRGSGGDTADASDSLYSAAAVDDPVGVVHQPPVRYPPALARTGVTGRVELEYVVDTLGRAEPGSLHTLLSTHPAFEASARAAILASRYHPARLRGHVVRQLVRQTLTFRLER